MKRHGRDNSYKNLISKVRSRDQAELITGLIGAVRGKRILSGNDNCSKELNGKMSTDKEPRTIAFKRGRPRWISAFTSLSEIVFEFPVEWKGNQTGLETQKPQFPSFC